MNLLQALTPILAPYTPTVRRVFDAAPSPVPAGPYAVVTDMRDDPESKQDFNDCRLTVLVTVYGAEGMALSDMRTLYRAVKALEDTVTQHPGTPGFVGIWLGPCWPPTQEEDVKRPWFGVRFNLRYME